VASDARKIAQGEGLNGELLSPFDDMSVHTSSRAVPLSDSLLKRTKYRCLASCA